MKKAICLISISMLIFTGCGKDNNENGNANNNTDIITTETTTIEETNNNNSEETPKNPYTITSLTNDSEVTSEDGAVILKLTSSYPAITENNSEIVSNINKQFEEKSKEFIEEAKNGEPAKNALTAYKAANGNTFSPFTMQQSYEVTYNKNNILSVVNNYLEETGNDLPEYSKQAFTYDMKTGNMLAITDILNISEEEINTIVTENFTNIIKASPEAYYDDAITTLSDNLEYLNYYLTENGIVFYFQPYIISPYETSYPQFTLMYNDNPDIFQPVYH